jgi:hypothetical protein
MAGQGEFTQARAPSAGILVFAVFFRSARTISQIFEILPHQGMVARICDAHARTAEYLP